MQCLPRDLFQNRRAGQTGPGAGARVVFLQHHHPRALSSLRLQQVLPQECHSCGHTDPAELWGCSAGACKDTEHSNKAVRGWKSLSWVEIRVLALKISSGGTPLSPCPGVTQNPASQTPDPPKLLLPGGSSGLIPSLRFLLSQNQRGPRRLLSLILAFRHGRYAVIKNQK